jgi:SM-20-related protein
MDQLAEQDYLIVNDFISDEMFHLIMDFFREKEKNNELKKAGIGKSGELQVNREIRGDFIYWLNPSEDKELSLFFDLINLLSDKLRKYCYLSLPGSEFHIAKYPKGSFYKRHLDQLNNRSNRFITVLIYLNENWKPGDGGELKIYGVEKEITVEPVAKRLILFKSEIVEHEVLPTRVPRYSLTGWLLKQPAEISFLLG